MFLRLCRSVCMCVWTCIDCKEYLQILIIEVGTQSHIKLNPVKISSFLGIFKVNTVLHLCVNIQMGTHPNLTTAEVKTMNTKQVSILVKNDTCTVEHNTYH